MNVLLEEGTRKTFASALEWPGYSRAGVGAEEALHALMAYGPRYRAVIGARRGFRVPARVDEFRVVERLSGDASTDFGVPGRASSWDARPVTPSELRRLTGVLEASWSAFDAAAAATRTLRVGPRGGGRDVARMRAHALEGERSYLTALGGRAPARATLDEVRAAFLDALARRARGELPDAGPRGGLRWNARYAIRRSAWHSLDHSWEIDDRAE